MKWDQKSPVSNKSYDTDFCALPCDCFGITIRFFRGYADIDVTFCSKISGGGLKKVKLQTVIAFSDKIVNISGVSRNL